MTTYQKRHAQDLKKLTAMPIADLKALWDRYDGINEPDGYAGEDIHMVLNQRGEGYYCAV